MFSLSVCVVLAITSSQAIAGESPAIRLLSIPRVTTPPQIDGEAGDKEWATAAATTGFMKQPDLIASTGQPLVQVAYDDDAVYVAFVSSRWEKNHATETLRDGGGELQILRDEDRVDVFLQPDPPSGPWFQFTGSLTGKTSVERDGKPSAAKFSYRSHGTEDLWVAEFAIPFAAMDISCPTDRTAWGVNFWRRYSSPREWSAWGPGELFQDPRNFGRLHFGGAGPRVRLAQLGNLSRADIDLQGVILADAGRFVFSVQAGSHAGSKLGLGVGDSEKALKLWEATLGNEGAVTAHLEVSQDSVPLNFQRKLDPDPSRVTWEITRESDGLVLQRQAVDFDPLPYLTVKVWPNPDAGTIRVELDAMGMFKPGTILTGDVSFIDVDSEKATLSSPAVFDAVAGTADFNLSGLPVGTYRVTADVASDKGLSTQTSVEFKYPGKVPEEYAGLGYVPEVPAPWTPVEIKGRQVCVWNRSMIFNGSGLPSSIRAAGQEALARPVSLRAYKEGKEMRSKMGIGSVKLVSPGSAEATGSIEWKGLTVNTRCLTEFDGCVRVELELSAEPKSAPDQLVLEIPILAKFANLMHAQALPGTHKAGFIPAGSGVVWQQEFFWPVIWLGNTEAGVSWFADSEEGWVLGDGPGQEIVRKASEVLLRISLARKSFPPGKKRRIVFGLHPTPTKPLPADWRRTRFVGANPYLPEDSERRDSYVGDPAGMWYGWCTPKTDKQYNLEMADINSGKWNRSSYSRQLIKESTEYIHSVGGRMLWFYPLQFISVHNPWCHTYGEPWALTGAASLRTNDLWWEARPVCPSAKQWQDLYIGSLYHAMEKYDYDGVYLDLFIPFKCNNPKHGCGYIDDNGERQHEYTFWAMREQMKRLYRIVKARENGFLVDHISMVLMSPLQSFVDVHVNGEHYWRDFALNGEIDYHNILPLDMCQSDLMGRQWGWIPLWLPMFKDPQLIPDLTASSRQLLSLILLHDSLILPAYMDTHEYHQANAVLTNLGFVDSEYIGYFESPAPAKTNNPDVLVSAYRKPNGDTSKAILIITNHGDANGVRVMVIPNRKTLGLPGGMLKAMEYYDTLTAKPRSCWDNRFRIEIGPKDFRIVSIRIDN